MQRALFLFALLLVSTSAEASTSLQDAFFAYAKMRRLEHERDLVPYLRDDKPEQTERAQKISAELSQARIDFYGIARSDEKLLSSWEKQLLNRVGKRIKASDKSADSQALEFLASSFPHARKFGLVEWEVVREWFGKKTEMAFLKTAFGAKELPSRYHRLPGGIVLWVRTLSPENSLLEKSRLQKKFADLKSKLAKEGYSLEALDISPFARADDQATELVQAVSVRKTGPAVLLSEAKAGAVIYRALDIYPGFRQSERINGWVNINGQLYGEAPMPGRGLASVADPVANSAAEAKMESYRLYRENLGINPALVKGFPIMNVLSPEKALQGSLREGVVTDGTTWFAPTGQTTLTVPAALSAISEAGI